MPYTIGNIEMQMDIMNNQNYWEKSTSKIDCWALQLVGGGLMAFTLTKNEN